MKNSQDGGFDQHYNAQVAVDQESLLIVANTVSNHANDKREAVPTVDAIDERLGRPDTAALDNGYYSESNIAALESRGIDPYRDGSRGASPELARVFREGAGTASGDGERQREDGLQTPD